MPTAPMPGGPDQRQRARVALITGASSGIGEALALELGARGYALALTARRADRLEALAAKLRERGIQVSVHPADSTDRTAVAVAVRDILTRWSKVDVAVLNAGVGLSTDFLNFEAGHLEAVYRLNVFGVAYWIEGLLPGMLQHRSGTIAGVSSLAAHIGAVNAGAYASSKAALSTLLSGLRGSLTGTGVHVLTVEPGFVKSEMTAENKWMLFVLETDDAARRIANAIQRKKTILRFPRRAAFLVRCLRLLPESWMAKFSRSVGPTRK